MSYKKQKQCRFLKRVIKYRAYKVISNKFKFMSYFFIIGEPDGFGFSVMLKLMSNIYIIILCLYNVTRKYALYQFYVVL